jgi:hypothetical protein
MKEWPLFIFIPFLLHAETVWKADLQKPFTLTIQFHSQHIAVTESLHLEAELHYPSSYRLDSDALIHQLTWSANPLAPQWILLKSHLSSFSPKEGIEAQRLSLTLVPLIAGQLQLSFLTVSFLPKETGGSPLEVMTPIFTFDVGQPPAATSLPLAPLIPLEPQFPLELTQANRNLFIDNPQELERSKELIRRDLEARSFPWIALAVLLGCGGMGWFLYLTRDRWFKRSTKPLPVISPKQQIDQALQALQNRSFNLEQAPLYYAELSSILHNAIQARSGWAAQKMTTPELALAMRKHALLPSDQIDEALFLLTETDQVKFAGKKPSPIEAKQFSQHIQQFIKKLF